MKTQEQQKEIMEEYPEPLNYLLVDLVAQNEKLWLDDKDRSRTYGADSVRSCGLTMTQKKWADIIKDQLEED